MNKRSIHNLLSKVFSCWLLICIIFCAANIFAQENIGYEDKGKRDPFIALVTPDGQLLNLEPTGSGSKIFLSSWQSRQSPYSSNDAGGALAWYRSHSSLWQSLQNPAVMFTTAENGTRASSGWCRSWHSMQSSPTL